MQISPNKLFLNYLQRVLPFFIKDFNDVATPKFCGILPNNEFYIDVEKTDDIDTFKLSANHYINITQLFFKYTYESYTVKTKCGNGFYIRVVKDGIDRQVGKETLFFLKVEDDIIQKTYYSVDNVEYDTQNNKTIISILINDHNTYPIFRDASPQKTIEIYTDYGNSLSGYNGYKEIKSTQEHIISGITYIRLILEKDGLFNFTVNNADFICDNAQIHYNIRIRHCIPAEFKHSGIQEYMQKKENVMIVNIESGRTDEGSFSYNLNYTKNAYIPMRYRVEMHLFFYRNLSENETSEINEQEAVISDDALSDGITDKMLNAVTHITQVCSLYQEMVSKKIQQRTVGGMQNIHRISTPSINPMGNLNGNMQHYLLTMEAEGDVFTFNPNILQEQFMIKDIQGNVVFETYQKSI